MLIRCGEECSHVAAILFKVEACTWLEISKLTCTSLPCTWNQVFSETVCNKYYDDYNNHLNFFRLMLLLLLTSIFKDLKNYIQMKEGASEPHPLQCQLLITHLLLIEVFAAAVA